MKYWINYLIAFSIILSYSCNSEPQKKQLPFKNKKDYKEKMILSHQAFLKEERNRIEHFVDSLAIPFKKTGTGLRYYITKKNQQGESLKAGDIALIKYTLTSIYGDTLYVSPKGMTQEFIVDFDNLENGLHEGIKYMKTGEEALLILPAHLAHGVTGDQAAIGSQQTLVYQLSLLRKK